MEKKKQIFAKKKLNVKTKQKYIVNFRLNLILSLSIPKIDYLQPE